MNEEPIMLNESVDIAEEHTMSEVPHQAVKCRWLPISLRLALAMLLCIAAVFCKLGSPDTSLQLQRWIIGDGSERIQRAFFSMEDSMEEGNGVADAWQVFCRELVNEEA